MPQSFCKIYAHLVFSTKGRYPFLRDEIRPEVHAYMASLVRDLNSSFVVVGGVADHAHILLDIGKSHAPVNLVQEVKKKSSRFVKTLGPPYRQFYWQRGYGMFSVGLTQVSQVEAYVRNQAEHHRTRSFKDEFRALLNRYGIAFDERYVWD